MRRLNYYFLIVLPFLAIALAAPQALKVLGVHQIIGGVVFLAMALSVWRLGAHSIRTGTEAKQRQAMAGVLLLAPFALIALFWVGLGPPWETTLVENRMRYLVLLAGSIATSAGFILLREELHEMGERRYSALAFSANVLAATAYLVWLTFTLGVIVVTLKSGEIPSAAKAMVDVYDFMLAVACWLTYLTTAAFAASLGRVGWLSIGASRAYVVAGVVAMAVIALSVIAPPDPTSGSTPWYIQPGFVLGIPAIPWIMSYLFGVVLLRRAGDP